MKKIENLLLLPIVVILLLLLFAGNSTLDVHLHDTYYVISPAVFIIWPLQWLVVLFLLYKLIRYRDGQLDRRWTLPHIVGTLASLVIIYYYCYSFDNNWSGGILDYSQAYSARPRSFKNLSMVFACLVFVAAQVIFLVYLALRLIKSPRRP